MSLITSYKGSSRSADASDTRLPDRLNDFYARFDKDNTTIPDPTQTDEYSQPSLILTEHDVIRSFARLKEKKAPGPDNISPRLVKLCRYQLAPVFKLIFNWSLEECVIPDCFKKSTIIPIPKKAAPIVLNDYRPVALTSVIMKSFEFLFRLHINSILPPGFDNYQFAYKKNRSVDDAISITVHEILQHLEKPKSYVRVLFLDFSSAFNTIIPQKLYLKLLELKFPLYTCNWILNFLLNRPQVVKISHNMSSSIVLSTGAPQGCVLSPTLYSIFTHDCITSNESDNLVVKFADDTTDSGFILDDDESRYRGQVSELEDWFDHNNLLLNVTKTKEMIIDFRKKVVSPPPPLIIKGEVVEQVPSFKLLGTFLNNTLTWNTHILEILKKARQRLYFLRKLKSFGVKNEILQIFYCAIIQQVLTQSITNWYDRATQSDIAKLNSVIKNSERIVGTSLLPLQFIYHQRLEGRVNRILKDKNHPAQKYFEYLPHGKRFRAFYGNRRFVDSFFPSAVKHFNMENGRSS